MTNAINFDIQTIKNTHSGQELFAVIPMETYRELMQYADIVDDIYREKMEQSLPLEVVEMNVQQGFSLIKSWRVYLEKNQEEIAERMQITEGEFSQIEEQDTANPKEILKKVAQALGINPQQLLVLPTSEGMK